MYVRATRAGTTVVAYQGDAKTLLAFDLDESATTDLAGFTIGYTVNGSQTFYLRNTLSFEHPANHAQVVGLPSTSSVNTPFHRFRWLHVPGAGIGHEPAYGTYRYQVTPRYVAGGQLQALDSSKTVAIDIELAPFRKGAVTVSFTRGFVQSQAFVHDFGPDALFRPKDADLVFDTSAATGLTTPDGHSYTWDDEYAWLGFSVRRTIRDLLDEVVNDAHLSLDVFAYDLDEPDVIKQLGQLGSRLRMYLDDSDTHVGAKALEPKAHAWLVDQGAEIKVGHFQRFSHDKVMIQKRDDAALKVLSGSANFSVRGLYVQSNNIFVFDDPATAALYEQAFQQSWDDPKGYASSPLAASWHDAGGHDGLPSYSVCLSPHHDPDVSLKRVADAVTSAKSSVLFAIMEIGTGGGQLLDAIKALPARPELYAFGTTQRLDGDLRVQKSGDPGTFIPFSYLSKHVPAPFQEEWSGGAGQVIHHKFVVTDFNGENPLAFGGSSNLAKGGEHENGDNLVCFADRDIATKYAIEAIKLVDHYRFRAVMETATDDKPLQLAGRSANWAAPYYEPGSPKSRERTVLVMSP